MATIKESSSESRGRNYDRRRDSLSQDDCAQLEAVMSSRDTRWESRKASARVKRAHAATKCVAKVREFGMRLDLTDQYDLERYATYLAQWIDKRQTPEYCVAVHGEYGGLITFVRQWAIGNPHRVQVVRLLAMSGHARAKVWDRILRGKPPKCTKPQVQGAEVYFIGTLAFLCYLVSKIGIKSLIAAWATTKAVESAKGGLAAIGKAAETMYKQITAWVKFVADILYDLFGRMARKLGTLLTLVVQSISKACVWLYAKRWGSVSRSVVEAVLLDQGTPPEAIITLFPEDDFYPMGTRPEEERFPGEVQSGTMDWWERLSAFVSIDITGKQMTDGMRFISTAANFSKALEHFIINVPKWIVGLSDFMLGKVTPVSPQEEALMRFSHNVDVLQDQLSSNTASFLVTTRVTKVIDTLTAEENFCDQHWLLRQKDVPRFAVTSAYNTAKAKLCKIRTQRLQALRAGHVRPCPVWIYIWGKSGVGKSYCVPRLMKSIWKHTQEEGEGSFDNNHVFNLNQLEEFWDGYKGQYFVLIDDFFQMRDLQCRTQVANTMINAVSTNPFSLRVAEISDKAATLFTSSCIISTTNITNLKESNCGITDYQALMGRRSLVLELVERDKFVLRSPEDDGERKVWINGEQRSTLSIAEVALVASTMIKAALLDFDVTDDDLVTGEVDFITPRFKSIGDEARVAAEMKKGIEERYQKRKAYSRGVVPKGFDESRKAYHEKAAWKLEMAPETFDPDKIPDLNTHTLVNKAWKRRDARREESARGKEKEEKVIIEDVDLDEPQGEVQGMMDPIPLYKLPYRLAMLLKSCDADLFPYDEWMATNGESWDDFHTRIWQEYDTFREYSNEYPDIDWQKCGPPRVKFQPIYVTVAAVASLAAAALVVYKIFSRTIPEVQSIDGPKPKKAGYRAMSRAGRRTTSARARRSENVQAVDSVLKKIAQNYVWVYSTDDPDSLTVTGGVWALFTHANVCVVPFHFLREGMTHVVFGANGRGKRHVVPVSQLKWEHLEGDIALMTIPNYGLFKDIRKHFCEDLPNYGKAVRLDPDEMSSALVIQPATSYKPQLADWPVNGYTFKTDLVFYDVPNQKGDCGLVYIHQQTSKIFGMHLAGRSDKSICYAASLFARDLSTDAVLDAPDFPLDLEEKEAAPLLPGTQVLGVVQKADASFIPRETKIEPAQWDYEDFPLKKSTSLPAALAPRDGMSPLKIALDAYDLVSTAYEPKTDPVRWHPQNFDPSQLRCLTVEEAIFGIPGFLDSIDFNTSAGYFYKKMHLTRRDLTRDGVVHETLKRDVLHRFVQLMRGECILTIYEDNLKDELRDADKVATCNTRLFNSADLASFIATRMVMGTYLGQMIRDPASGPCALGLDPHAQWSILYRRLKGKGDTRPCAGDAKKYDRSLPQYLYEEFVKVVQKVHPQHMHAAIRAAVYSMPYGYHFAGAAVYRRPWGTKSGHLLTALFNTFCNYYLHKCAWDLYAPDESEPESSFTGDDSIFGVPVNSKLTEAKMAEFFDRVGITYTASDKKSGFDVLGWHEVRYLKRLFVETTDRGILCPLPEETLYNMVAWSKTGVHDREHRISVCRSLLTEASYFPIEVRDKVQAWVNKQCITYGLVL